MTLPGSYLLFALPLSLRKENTASPQETSRMSPEREENEKEKEDEKTAKKQMSVSMNVISLLVFLSL